jgi:hypothetical protein
MPDTHAAELDEPSLHRLVRAALAAELPSSSSLHNPSAELLAEALLAELLDAPPRSADALRAAVTNVCSVAPGLLGDDEIASLAGGLWDCITAERAAAAAAAAAARAPAPGCCALCERRMPLTDHHLRPRSQHARLRASGFSLAELSAVLMICRQCHNAVHEHVDEETLASSYYTADLLLGHAGVLAFVRWAAKQRERGDASPYLQVRR